MASKIIISGRVVENPEYSHKAYEDEMYMFTIASKRLSGTEDFIPIQIHKGKLCEKIACGERVKIIGEIRTHTFMYDGKGRSYLSVLADDVVEPEDQDENYVVLDGMICTEPFYKRTNLTKKRITDFAVRSKRKHATNDHIKCIVWNGCAGFARHLEKGTCLVATGRLQSRAYRKTAENGKTETRVVYEVSTKTLNILGRDTENG